MKNVTDKINKRLDKAIRNLENPNFEELFPLILEDLEYILVYFNSACKRLSDGESLKNGRIFEDKKNIYFSRLAEIYFKLVFGETITIISTNDYNLSTCAAGYNWNDGNIYTSYIGSIFAKTSDLTFLHTCLHEGRHKMQHSMYKEANPLSFMPHMLKALKEGLLERSLCDNNRQFYTDNYYQLFEENDAEYFAKSAIYNFINALILQYVESSKIHRMKWTYLQKTKKLSNIFKAILCDETFEIDENIIKQLYGGIVIGEHIIEEQRYDKLILMDKYTKSHPELQEQYPILKLLFNGTTAKDYEQIKQDRKKQKENLNPDDQNKIDELYNEIIKLDPILMISDLLEKGDVQAVREYIDLHPSIPYEYPTEIESLREKYGQFSGGVK